MKLILLILLTSVFYTHAQIIMGQSVFGLTPSSIGSTNALLNMKLVVSVSTPITIPTGSTMSFVLPSGYTMIGTTCSCSTSGITISACTVSSQTISLTFVAVTSSPVAINLNVTGLSLPKKIDPAAYFSLTISSAGTAIYTISPTTVIPLTPAVMSSCTLGSPSNNNVGGSSTVILTLVTTNYIASGGTIKLAVPGWADTGLYYLDSATVSCTNGANAYVGLSCTFNAGVLTIINVVNFDYSGPLQININNMRNPPSLAASSAFSLTSQSGSTVYETCANMKFSVTTPGAITGWAMSCNPNTVQTVTSCSIYFTNTNYLQGGSDFTIILPPEVSTNNVVSLPAAIPNDVYLTSYTASSISFNAPSPSNGGTNFQLFLQSSFISSVSTATSSSFTVKTFQTVAGVDYEVDIGNSGFSFPAATPGNLPITSITASPSTAGATANYQFIFTPNTALSSAGGLYIVFPPTVSVPSCTYVSGSGGISNTPTCVLTAANTVLVKNLFSSPYTPSGPMTITLAGMINPKSTAPTTPFQVKTEYNTSVTNSFVDANTSYVLSTITAGVLSPSTVYIVPSTYVTSDYPITYQLSFTSVNPITTGGSLTFKFPTGCLSFPTLITNVPPLSPFNINPSASITVSSGGGFDTFSVTNAFATNFNSPAQFNFSVAQIKNPATTATCYGIQVSTYDISGNLIDQTSSGATLTMTTPHPYSNVAIVTDTVQNGRVANYTISLQLKEIHYNTDIISFQFPNTLTLLNSPAVALIVGSQAGVTLGTAIKSGNTVSVSLITGTPIPSGAFLNFLIKSVTNTQPSTSIGNILVTTTDSLLNYREQTNQPTGLSTSPAIMTGPPSALTLSSYIRADTNVIYTFNLVQWNLIPTGGYIDFVFPTDITAPTGPSCAGSGGAAVTTCTTIAVNNTIRVFGTFSSTNSIISIPLVSNPNKNNSFAFTIYTYNSAGVVLDKLSTDLLYNANCDLPCMTCQTGQRTNCTACFQNTAISSNNLFLPTNVGASYGTCIATCSITMTNISGTCTPCTSPCYSCISATTTCQSCVPTFFLFGTTCVNSCTGGYYADALTQSCQLCTTGCTSCTSATVCTACTTGLFLFNGTCVANCPLTYFNNVNQCTKCPSPCNTCSSLAFCQSCLTGFAYYQSVCYSYGNCPSGLASNGTDCTTCSVASGCATCYGSITNCTSCLSTFFLSGGLCQTTCPPGTYPDNSTQTCKTCDPTCATCSGGGPTACLTCITGGAFPYHLSTGRCSATCPNGFYGDPSTQTCITCNPACSLCTGGSTAQCQACNSPNLYYAPTTSCLSQCPINVTVAVGGVCTACDPSCVTCSQSIYSCTSCNSGVYLLPDQSKCLSTCDPGRYIMGSQCLKCGGLCLTCNTSATNCLSCGGNTFLYANSCLTACPKGYLTDVVNNLCIGNCTGSNCGGNLTVSDASVVPFPFLISSLVVFLGLSAAKASNKETIIPSNFLAFLSIIELAAWITATAFLTIFYNAALSFQNRDMFFIAIGIILNYIANLLHIGAVCSIMVKDDLFKDWRKQHNHQCITLSILAFATITSFRFFRLVYSRLMGHHSLSALLKNAESLKIVHWITIGTFIAANGSVILGSFLYLQQNGWTWTQLAVTTVEIPILSFMVACCTVLDVNKPASFYDPTAKNAYRSKIKPLRDDMASVDKVHLDLNNSGSKLLNGETHEDVVASYISGRKDNLLNQSAGNFVETHENLLPQSHQGSNNILFGIGSTSNSAIKSHGHPPTPDISPQKLNKEDFHKDSPQVPVQSEFDEIKPKTFISDFVAVKDDDHKIKKPPIFKPAPADAEETSSPTKDQTEKLEDDSDNPTVTPFEGSATPMEETVYATRQQLLARVDSKRTSEIQTRQNSTQYIAPLGKMEEYWNTDRSAAPDEENPAHNDPKPEMIKPPVHTSEDLGALGILGTKPAEMPPEQMIIEKKIARRKYLNSDEEETTSVDMKSTDLGSVIHYRDKYKYHGTDIPTSAIEEDLTENEEIIKRKSVNRSVAEEKSAEFATPISKRSSGVLQNPLETKEKFRTPTNTEPEMSIKDNPYDLSLSFRKNNFFNDPSRTGGTSNRYNSHPQDDFDTEFSKGIFKDKSGSDIKSPSGHKTPSQEKSASDLLKPKAVDIDFDEMARDNARKKAIESKMAEEARKADEQKLAEEARIKEDLKIREESRKEPEKSESEMTGSAYRKMKKQVQKTPIQKKIETRTTSKILSNSQSDTEKSTIKKVPTPVKQQSPVQEKHEQEEISDDDSSNLRVSRDSLNQSVGNSKDMIHEDTPSNYNVLNQRFDESEIPTNLQRKAQFMTLGNPESMKNTLATPSSTIKGKGRQQYADEPGSQIRDGLPWNRKSRDKEGRRSKTMPKKDDVRLPKIDKKESLSGKKEGNKIQGFKVFEADDTYSDFMKDTGSATKIEKKRTEHTLPSITSKK